MYMVRSVELEYYSLWTGVARCQLNGQGTGDKHLPSTLWAVRKLTSDGIICIHFTYSTGAEFTEDSRKIFICISLLVLRLSQLLQNQIRYLLIHYYTFIKNKQKLKTTCCAIHRDYALLNLIMIKSNCCCQQLVAVLFYVSLTFILCFTYSI